MCVLYQHQTRREKITFFTLASIDSQSAAWLTESNRIESMAKRGRKIKPSLTRAWGGKWNVHKLLTLWSASNETLLAREAFREMKQSAKGAQSERVLARLIPSLCRKHRQLARGLQRPPNGPAHSAFVNHVRIQRPARLPLCFFISSRVYFRNRRK